VKTFTLYRDKMENLQLKAINYGNMDKQLDLMLGNTEDTRE